MSDTYNGSIILSKYTESKLLSLEYMKQQNLSALTPEEIADRYRETQTLIYDRLVKKK